MVYGSQMRTMVLVDMNRTITGSWCDHGVSMAKYSNTMVRHGSHMFASEVDEPTDAIGRIVTYTTAETNSHQSTKTTKC